MDTSVTSTELMNGEATNKKAAEGEQMPRGEEINNMGTGVAGFELINGEFTHGESVEAAQTTVGGEVNNEGTSVVGFGFINGQSAGRETMGEGQSQVRREMNHNGDSNCHGINGNGTPHMTSIHPTNEHPKSVRIPDMFGSIMSAEAQVNPNHFKVKVAADVFIAEYLKLDKTEADKNRKADFCFCASAMAPHADPEALRTMVDWLNWIFYFDDDFDEGHLDHDPAGAESEVNQTLAVLETDSPIPDREEHPLRYLFFTIWERIKKRASPSMQLQFKMAHQRYLDGLMHQVEATRTKMSRTVTEEDYITMRRRTVGGYPCVSLIAYAHGVDLPMAVFQHPSLQECIAVGCDLAWIHNDIVSYKKDVKSGIEHNLITVLRKLGFSTQMAMDRAGQLQQECYRRWYLALANMPVWGEAMDRQVLQYVSCCHTFSLGDLLWSFQTSRYLGAAEGHRLHATRLLDLSDLTTLVK